MFKINKCVFSQIINIVTNNVIFGILLTKYNLLRYSIVLQIHFISTLHLFLIMVIMIICFKSKRQ